MRLRRSLTAVALGTALCAGCATSAGDAEVRGLASPAATSDLATSTTAAGTHSSSRALPAAPSTTTPAPPTPAVAPGDGDPEVLRARVDEVLARYARALTDLARDPLRFGAPGTAQRTAWDAVVLPGSGLSSDMLTMLVERQREQGKVVVPDQGELSYRHRPLLVEPPHEGTISFTWCGWSPGIGLEQSTGAVIDDAVAHAHGTGQLRLVEGRWMLDSLDQLELEVLPPASADPCPAEVAAVAVTGAP